MSFRSLKRTLAFVLLGITSMGASQSGCPQGTLSTDANINLPLAGVWEITRGTSTAIFKWNFAGGGEVKQDSGGGSLQPLDPNSFPPDLRQIVDQWNAGLADFNAKLDAAVPKRVLVTFPRYGVIRLVNLDETSRIAEGAINAGGEYIFVGDLSGAPAGSQLGGGAFLQASTVRGAFDRAALTTNGAVARSVHILLNSNDDRFGFNAQISIVFTGLRTGNAPSS